MNIEGVPEILAALLSESDEFDAKELYHPDAEYQGDWVQIGGDYGDAWVYGGDWHNAHKQQVLHFDGIEHDDEMDYRAIEIPERVMAKIKANVHDPELDTMEDDEHKRWLLNREENEIDRIADNYRVARASFLADRQKHIFWLIDLDQKWLVDSLKEKEAELAKQFEAGTWDEFPFEQKVLELGRYWGFQDIGEEMRMNHIEVKEMLGTKRNDLTGR
jgi:hypothetical protein